LKIIFRCDASKDIGLGHLIRCLAIADCMDTKNEITFALNKNNIADELIAENYESINQKKDESELDFLLRVKEQIDPDVIVIDKKYNYKKKDFFKLKESKINVVLIDVLCEGLELADEIIIPGAFIDDNIFPKYLSSVRIKSIKKGPKYIIVNKNLPSKVDLDTKKFKHDKNIIITVGGTDPSGVLFSILSFLSDLELDVSLLVGDHFKHKDKLIKLDKMNPCIHIVPFNLAKLVKADIAICTFGVTLYELLYLGIPTICISHNEENALSSSKLVSKYPYFIDMGHIDHINKSNFVKFLKRLIKDEDYYNNIALNSFELIDGNGAKRIAALITNII